MGRGSSVGVQSERKVSNVIQYYQSSSHSYPCTGKFVPAALAEVATHRCVFILCKATIGRSACECSTRPWHAPLQEGHAICLPDDPRPCIVGQSNDGPRYRSQRLHGRRFAVVAWIRKPDGTVLTAPTAARALFHPPVAYDAGECKWRQDDRRPPQESVPLDARRTHVACSSIRTRATFARRVRDLPHIGPLVPVVLSVRALLGWI